MKRKVKLGLMTVVAATGLALVATPALADPIQINLNQVYTGTAPEGGTPWLTATFTASNDTQGTLTLKSNLPNGGGTIKGASGVIGWGFNLGSNGVTAYNCTAGTCGSVILGSLNSGPVPGPFNLGFGWSPAHGGDVFEGGDTATYTLTFANSFTTSPFIANESGWISYAHVQQIGPTGCSGYIVSGNGSLNPNDKCGAPPTSVPEPAELGMFGLGLLLIGGFFGLRCRFPAAPKA